MSLRKAIRYSVNVKLIVIIIYIFVQSRGCSDKQNKKAKDWRRYCERNLGKESSSLRFVASANQFARLDPHDHVTQRAPFYRHKYPAINYAGFEHLQYPSKYIKFKVTHHTILCGPKCTSKYLKFPKYPAKYIKFPVTTHIESNHYNLVIVKYRANKTLPTHTYFHISTTSYDKA
jgi:hypothetical protein